jgi:hypothetical protein
MAGTVIAVANRWPQLAMSLSTAEPPVTQMVLRIGGAVLGGAMLALLLGLAAGVGAWSARAVPPWGGSRRATWLAGVGAALVSAGLVSALQALSPREAPLWPSLALAGTAFPWIGALAQGLTVVSASAVGLFALHVLERVTSHWTRRRWLVVVLLVLLFTSSAASESDPLPALIGGLIEAAIASALVLALFRHAPRAVPPFVATTILLEAAERTALQGSGIAWGWFALTALVVVVATWAIDRHLEKPLAAPDAEPA